MVTKRGKTSVVSNQPQELHPFELPVYKQLASVLAAHGYAVFRYDKRTCGAFNDCSESGPAAIPYSMLSIELSTAEYVRDAQAAIDLLLQHPAVDPSRTFFVGHSEGAQLVPALLSERPSVRAGVMLAPPFHTMTVLLEQQGKLLRWAFAATGQRERAEREGQVLLDAARSLRQIEQGTHLGAPILGQPPGIWASWVGLASRAPALARGLDRPLLVLGGRYDYNVAASEIEEWGEWLKASSGVKHRVRVLDCVTHALNCITQPDPRRITAADISHDLSPELVQEVTSFLDAQAPSERRGRVALRQGGSLSIAGDGSGRLVRSDPELMSRGPGWDKRGKRLADELRLFLRFPCLFFSRK